MAQVFFDDSARNIATGKAAGFHTVIVSLNPASRTQRFWFQVSVRMS
jgi:beta-phosphoglucomutase-like phosphatase (HAD superfamily)